MSGSLVGLDGSDHSRRALSWAMREAAHHHVPVTVMSVHPAPARPATQVYWNVPDLPDNSFDPEPARRAIQEMVDAIATEIGETPPGVTVMVVTGDPKVTHHAACPVMVIRGTG